MATALLKEFRYYVDHQEELVEQYLGKHVVIKGRKVLGAYDNALTAIQETEKEHELGTFLVQKVESGEDAYTQTFQSRVSF